MFRDQTEKRLVIRGRGQTAAQVPDLFTDVLVVPPPVLGNGLVMAEGGKAVQVQIPLHGRKIVVEQGPKDPKIVPGKVVHRASWAPTRSVIRLKEFSLVISRKVR